MITKAKEFISKYKFDDIFNNNFTKDKIIIKEFVDICTNIRTFDFDIPALCPNCALKSRINQGLEIINLFIKRESMHMEKSKCDYRFKKGNGSGLVVTFKGSDYTNSNLTNKIAEELIKHNEKNIKLFDVIPAEIVIKETESNNESDLSNFTNEELISVAKLKGIDLSKLYTKAGKEKANFRNSLEKLLE